MQSEYQVLVHVRFFHGSFDGMFNGLALEVPASTNLTMLDHGLSLKVEAGGFKVLYETSFGGKTRTRSEVLKQAVILSFRLCPKDPHFDHYTSFGNVLGANSILHFSNPPDRPGHNLHQEDFVGEADWYPSESSVFRNALINPKKLDTPKSSKIFGLLSLQLHADLKERYFISFAAKAFYLRYIFINKDITELKGLAILGEDGSPHLFSSPVEIILPDKRKAILIVSKSRMQLAARLSLVLQLVEYYNAAENKYRCVIPRLPLPDIKSVSKLPFLDPPEAEGTFKDVFVG